MAPAWPDDRRTRWSRAVLKGVSLAVPRALRGAWLSEWEAELWQLRQGERGGAGLALFLLGACWHGAWEWKEGWRMEGTMQDARFALRTLARSPGFSASALAMLALSIGGCTALFSIVESAVLAKPPYPDPDRLVVVDMLFGMDDGPMNPSEWSYPRFEALREDVTSIGDMAGYALKSATLTELGDPAVVSVEVATPGLLPMLGIAAVRGRLFGPEEEYDGATKMVALVSESFWLTRMGGSPDAIGSFVTLDQLRFRVLGVLPRGFDGVTGRAELWIPMAALPAMEDPSILDDPWDQHFRVLGRLRDGASLDGADAEVAAFGGTIMERFPGPVGTSRLRSGAAVVPLAAARQNRAAAASMVALFGAVLMVLLIATANLAGLLLARGARRRQETAIRASLGAGRGRILRQLLTESLLLACLGGVLGVGVAWAGVDTLGSWLAAALGTVGSGGLEYFDADGLSVNWRVGLFAVLLTGGVGVACGIAPALEAARTDPNAWLRGATGVTGLRRRFGSWPGGDVLILGQVSIALILLTGASLMMSSMRNLQRSDPGFDREGLLTAIYSLTPADEQAGIDPATFHIDFLERLRALPGVTGATLGEVPMGGPTWRTIVLGSEGRPELDPAMHTWVRIQPVADGHLGVLGATLLEGRDIERSDDWNTEKVLVLGRSAAEELFPDGSPLGRRLQLSWPGYGGEGALVVGVVEDVQLGEPGEPLQRQAYASVRQAPQLETGALVRTAGDPDALIPAVRSALAELAPTVALTSVMSMEQRAAGATARPRVVTLMLSLFAGLSLFLVAAGLYGSIAFAVARRTREIGLRASLGAGRASLLALVLRQGVGLTVLGVAVGIVGSVWATRLLRGLLFETRTVEPVALAGAALMLVLVACVAAYLPARRAMRIDPMVALRTD